MILMILLPLGLSLGSWQMGRAEQKQAELDLRKTNTAGGPSLLQDVDTDTEDMLYRQVEMHGTFELQRQILLDNQKHNGVPGYHVYTPLQLQGSTTRVLVNRGWIKQGDDRRIIPLLAGPSAKVNIQGRVENIPSVGIKVGAPGESGKAWPKRVIYLDLDWLARETEYNLLPYVVYQTSGEEFGLVRDWRQQFRSTQRMTPEKHMGYAIQWFSLAGLTVIMYVILSFRKSGRRSATGVD